MCWRYLLVGLDVEELNTISDRGESTVEHFWALIIPVKSREDTYYIQVFVINCFEISIYKALEVMITRKTRMRGRVVAMIMFNPSH